ncbi:adenylate/guanylate cyclase domain-containing protein [Leptospira adleri]|uniref:Adenylate/guanylate cyclase domain-containing protein n=1 Tax=Leptospira adleri TaxID=2023186 RepID=A0A2M9YJU3_9LEPT|nr:adenylate/guanylate cyclase domain-containing protein [Leptospira adleri]PJZ51770.1 adenylate/guanylate cyclase domain-containing protein [Leptospira adleri]PJZ60351.1 adenylate/guanylate cyclase domain-containing protein [Leptospira adleri]
MASLREKESYSSYLEFEINSTLKKVSFYSFILGTTSAIALIWMQREGIVFQMQVPILWTLIGGGVSFFFYLLAKFKMAKGARIYFVILFYSTLPGILYVLAETYLPLGAATYITGPASYLYFFMVILSGFAMDERLSILSGSYCGIQYFIFYILSKDGVLEIHSRDVLQWHDLTDPPIYFFKSLMMVFSGIVVGVLVRNTKRLLSEVLEREKEKSNISRLFGQFVSEEVKEKLLSEGVTDRTEKKKVLVLFSDLRSFTSLSEKSDPDRLILQLNEYFDRMADCISRNGGTIDKFIGDAIMAVFGGLVEVDSPADAALRASKEMQIELENLNREWSLTRFPILESGIGLHYGEVVQGPIGSKNRLDFTVIGDSVNTASRIEGLCSSLREKILFSSTVYELLSEENRIQCKSLGKFKVKGRETEIDLYSLNIH